MHRSLLPAITITLAVFVLGCRSEREPAAQETSAGASEDKSELSGFGAPLDAWEAARGEPVEGSGDNPVYGPAVRDEAHRYSGVLTEQDGGDRVISYTRTFPRGTALEDAYELVLEDFPEDAKITTRDDDERACLVVRIESETLNSETGSHATVAYFSPPPPPEELDNWSLDRQDILDAMVMPDHNEGSDDLVGSC